MLKQKTKLLLAGLLFTGISFVACNEGEKKADETTPAADSPKMETPKVDTPVKAPAPKDSMDTAAPKPLKPGT
ncbi:MAG: hypothetical protein U0T68_06215 [Ferruginibacter sp.]